MEKNSDTFLKLYEPIHESFTRFCAARAYGVLEAEDLVSEQAANPKKIKDTVLVPERIQAAAEDEFENDVKNIDADMDANETVPRSDPQGDARSYDEDSPVRGDDVDESEEDFVYERETELDTPLPFDDDDDSDDEEDNVDVEQLEDALNTLTLLRARWKTFTST